MQYPTQDNKTGRKYNRRVELLKPTLVRDPVFNEEKLEMVVAYGNFPAKKFDKNTGENENLDGNLVKGKVQVQWELRFIPDLMTAETKIKTDWKLRDVFDKTLYTIVAPPTEVGFRQGISVLTEIVQ